MKPIRRLQQGKQWLVGQAPPVRWALGLFVVKELLLVCLAISLANTHFSGSHLRPMTLVEWLIFWRGVEILHALPFFCFYQVVQWGLLFKAQQVKASLRVPISLLAFDLLPKVGFLIYALSETLLHPENAS
jgi:hypothetical protein